VVADTVSAGGDGAVGALEAIGVDVFTAIATIHPLPCVKFQARKRQRFRLARGLCPSFPSTRSAFTAPLRLRGSRPLPAGTALLLKRAQCDQGAGDIVGASHRVCGTYRECALSADSPIGAPGNIDHLTVQGAGGGDGGAGYCEVSG
jgi:hypothetical protein